MMNSTKQTVSPLCRVCQKTGLTKMKEKLLNRNDTIKQCLIMCVPQMTNVSTDDWICETCVQELYSCVLFIEKCLKSQQDYQTIVAKIDVLSDDDELETFDVTSFNVNVEDLLADLDKQLDAPVEVVKCEQSEDENDYLDCNDAAATTDYDNDSVSTLPTVENVELSSDTFLLALDQHMLNSSASYLQVGLQQNGVKIVNMDTSNDNPKKILLVGSTNLSNTVVDIPSASTQILYPCIGCNKTFTIPNNYIIHYMTIHIKYPRETFQKAMPCLFCYSKLGSVKEFAGHLVGNHPEKIEELMKRENQTYRVENADVETASNIVPENEPANDSGQQDTVTGDVTVSEDTTEGTGEQRFNLMDIPHIRNMTFWPRPNQWLAPEETSMVICCKGLTEALPDMHIDLNKTGAKFIKSAPGCMKLPKRIILLGTTKADEPLIEAALIKRELFSCLICSRQFSSDKDYVLHFMEYHSYKCVHCLQEFQSTGELRKHFFKDHKSTPLYKCSKCEKDFPSKTSLTRHIQIFRDCPTCVFNCQECPKTFKHKRQLDSHVKSHSGQPDEKKIERRKLCHICGKEFISYNTYVAHKQGHNKRPQWVCPICGKSLTGGMKAHMEIHDPNRKKSFMCEQCAKTFSTIYSLRKHIEYKHNENVEIPTCDICNKKFSPGYSVATHKRLYHQRECKFKCDVCEREFVRRDYLNNHRRLHEKYGRTVPTFSHARISKGRNGKSKKSLSQAPFLCKICNKVLSCAAYKPHYNMHLNHRPFKCAHCDTKFTNKGACERHEKLHKDPTYRFSCRICFNKFKNDALLKEHMKKHESKMRYECKICGKRFGRRYLLENHRVNDHEDLAEKKRQLLEMALKEVVHVIPPGKEDEYNCLDMEIKRVLNEEDKKFQKIVNECREEM